jgi:hypothetical protein
MEIKYRYLDGEYIREENIKGLTSARILNHDQLETDIEGKINKLGALVSCYSFSLRSMHQIFIISLIIFALVFSGYLVMFFLNIGSEDRQADEAALLLLQSPHELQSNETGSLINHKLGFPRRTYIECRNGDDSGISCQVHEPLPPRTNSSSIGRNIPPAIDSRESILISGNETGSFFGANSPISLRNNQVVKPVDVEHTSTSGKTKTVDKIANKNTSKNEETSHFARLPKGRLPNFPTRNKFLRGNGHKSNSKSNLQKKLKSKSANTRNMKENKFSRTGLKNRHYFADKPALKKLPAKKKVLKAKTQKKKLKGNKSARNLTGKNDKSGYSAKSKLKLNTKISKNETHRKKYQTALNLNKANSRNYTETLKRGRHLEETLPNWPSSSHFENSSPFSRKENPDEHFFISLNNHIYVLKERLYGGIGTCRKLMLVASLLSLAALMASSINYMITENQITKHVNEAITNAIIEENADQKLYKMYIEDNFVCIRVKLIEHTEAIDEECTAEFPVRNLTGSQTDRPQQRQVLKLGRISKKHIMKHTSQRLTNRIKDSSFELEESSLI